jgi:hypothetical protein
MPSLSGLPDDVLQVHLIPFLPIESMVSLLLTARCFSLPVRACKQWEVAVAQLSQSNTFNLLVAEMLEGDPDADLSAFLLSDPRLDAAFSTLPAFTRFRRLATFCRATVRHLLALHRLRRDSEWSFQQTFSDADASARTVHIKKLVALEVAGRKRPFCRFNVMANLIKLNLAQRELCSSYGPSYWYDQLGEPFCGSFEGSSYRDSLNNFFLDAFVGDGYGEGQADPALTGVEVGSNAHLTHLTLRAGNTHLSQSLFGDKLFRNFTLLEAARAQLPGILQDLKVQEEGT